MTMAETEEFSFREWLAEGKRGMGLGVPEEFKTHMRAALREILLARRALLDAALQRLEERPGQTMRERQDVIEA
jgi:hypothetical protein